MTCKRQALLREFQARAATLREEREHLALVSPDECYRRGFEAGGLERAIDALSTGRLFLHGCGAKGVLVVGLERLPDEALERFVRLASAAKAEANWALVALDGQRANVRKNKAGTCWVIEIHPDGAPLFAWPAGFLPDGRPWETTGCTRVRLSGPRLPVTNGGAWWVGVVNATTPIDPEASPITAAFVAEGMAAMAKHGLTPLQRHEAAQRAAREAAARRAAIIEAAQEAGRRDGRRVVPEGLWNEPEGLEYIQAAEWLAGETGPLPPDLADRVHAEVAAARKAAEEARLAAEKAAEEARLAAEKAAREAAEAEARRKAEAEEAARKHAGLTPEQWAAMPEKRRRIAMHNARLAGLVQ